MPHVQAICGAGPPGHPGDPNCRLGSELPCRAVPSLADDGSGCVPTCALVRTDPQTLILAGPPSLSSPCPSVGLWREQGCRMSPPGRRARPPDLHVGQRAGCTRPPLREGVHVSRAVVRPGSVWLWLMPLLELLVKPWECSVHPERGRICGPTGRAGGGWSVTLQLCMVAPGPGSQGGRQSWGSSAWKISPGSLVAPLRAEGGAWGVS